MLLHVLVICMSFSITVKSSFADLDSCFFLDLHPLIPIDPDPYESLLHFIACVITVMVQGSGFADM